MYTARNLIQYNICLLIEHCSAMPIIEESFAMKGITKEDARALFSQMSDVCKLYANMKKFAVADGSENGGMFIRSICKCFGSNKFILQHEWSDIVIKIREYTKRESTIESWNFTQLVETESTLERPLVFGSKYLKLTPILPQQTDLGQIINASSLTVSNLSPDTTIAILVENKRHQSNRLSMLQKITNSTTPQEAAQSFDFVIIDASNSNDRDHDYDVPENENNSKYNDHSFDTTIF